MCRYLFCGEVSGAVDKSLKKKGKKKQKPKAKNANAGKKTCRYLFGGEVSGVKKKCAGIFALPSCLTGEVDIRIRRRISPAQLIS